MLKKFFSSLDWKSWVIIILIITSGIFFTVYMFSGSRYSQQIKNLTAQNKLYSLKSDTLISKINILKKSQSQDSINIALFQQQITTLNTELTQNQKQLSGAINNLNVAISQQKKTEAEIVALENKPIQRNGQDLLNHLK